ncbi:MAG: HAD-IIA family hydrolase [Clostridia bacterium]|nr:HAD-IIA family hydrolase [Clostridia bacterium]
MVDNTECFVLDMDGTIYLDSTLFDFTHDFLKAVRDSGRRYVFYTNNSSKKLDDYVLKLDKLGIKVTYDDIYISNQVIIKFLKENYDDPKLYVVGTPSLIGEFEKAGFRVVEEDPDLVIVGFDTTLTYKKLDDCCHYIRNGVKAYGVNMDYNCPTKRGFMPDCGSIAALIKASTGVQLEFFGKPSRHTFDYVVERTGVSPEKLTFVGDRMYTDIAVADGTPASSVLVMTGETTPQILADSPVKPTIVCRSLEELTEIIRAE